MKILLAFFLLSQAAFSNSFKCQVVLNGDKTYPDNLLIENTKNKNECIKEAKALLAKNKNIYNRVFILLKDKTIKIKLDEI